MKITPEHYAVLTNGILAIVQQFVRRHGPRVIEVYRDSLARDNPTMRSKDIDRQVRWDFLNAAKVDLRPIYEYANNDHIDTALRSIMKKVREFYINAETQ